jgi:hypothetical protein
MFYNLVSPIHITNLFFIKNVESTLVQIYDISGLKAKNLGKSGAGFYDGKQFVLKLTGASFKDKFK